MSNWRPCSSSFFAFGDIFKLKRICTDMKAQNLEAPVYSENEQAVILVLKNNIEQRNAKQKITATDGGNNGGDFEVNTKRY